MNLGESLKSIGTCSESAAWAAQYPTTQAAWDACLRGDWMLWCAGRVAGPPESGSRKRLMLAACACARLALPALFGGERRPLVAIETAEAWAAADATPEDVVAAGTEARDIAYDDDMSYRVGCDFARAHGADYAASAAAEAAFVVLGECGGDGADISAGSVADSAAGAHAALAARAAVGLAAAESARKAARTAALAECADIVRRYYPRPPA